jgi:hypothetical protein
MACSVPVSIFNKKNEYVGFSSKTASSALSGGTLQSNHNMRIYFAYF